MPVSRGDMSEETLERYVIPIHSWKAADGASLVVGATSGDHKIAVSTNDWHLVGNTPSSNTKTDISVVNFSMPPEYMPAGDVVFTVALRVDAAADTNTVDLSAYLLSELGGAAGSDIVATSAQSVLAADATAETSFTITGTTLYPGASLALKMTTVNNDADGSDGIVTIKATSIALDIRG